MKKWYLSKTLWVNLIGMGAIIAQEIAGHTIVDAQTQAFILGAINFGLRLITKHELIG